jgi:hypothetical protein
MAFYPDPEQSIEVGRHLTKTLNVDVVGWVTEATEGSVNANVKM